MRNLVARVALLGSLAAVSAMAEGLFIGGEGGYNFKNQAAGFDDGQPQIGVKAGYDFGTFRAYGGYFYGFKGEDSSSNANSKRKVKWSTHDFVAGADFTPELFGRFKLVLGAYAGLSVLDTEVKIDYSNGGWVRADDTLGGFILGGKIGTAYEFGSNSEIEMGFKASKAWYKDGDYIEDNDGKKYGVYAGYNYKF
ncbi:MAG: hypothetical protein ACFNVQ_01210 [Campylobacter sp.]|jgi:hypothetical protein|uniref:hypothetical protein n=1 Tax=uncultured Campylobacter sp. TaxID=218934 RepID=UPI0015B33B42|nr:hypothetical protein [uncultured Campylobacter sp.]